MSKPLVFHFPSQKTWQTFVDWWETYGKTEYEDQVERWQHGGNDEQSVQFKKLQGSAYRGEAVPNPHKDKDS